MTAPLDRGDRWVPMVKEALLWSAFAVVSGVTAGVLAGAAGSSAKWLIALPAAVVVVATLARPDWSLMVLTIIIYTNLSDTLSLFHGVPPVAKFYVLGLLAVIFLRWMAKGEPIGGNRPAIVCLFAYAAVCFLSAYVADDPHLTISSSTEFLKDAVIAIIVMTLLTTAAALKRVIWTLVIAALFVSSATLYQYITETYPVAAGGFARAVLGLIVVGVDDSYRHAGPLDDPNHFGQILVMVLPLAVERAVSESRWSLRLLALVAALAILGAVLLTYSRGALLGIFGIVVVFAVVHGRRFVSPKRLFGLAGVLFVVGTLITHVVQQDYLDRMSTMASMLPGDKTSGGGIVAEKKLDIAVEGRLGEMTVAAHMFLDHPFIGVGFGNFELHYQRYELKLGLPPRHVARSAHSLPLEIAAELGLVGLGAFAMILVVMAQNVVRSVRALTAAGRFDVARTAEALGYALLAYLIVAMSLHNSYARYFWLLAGIIFALPKIAAADDRANSADESVRSPSDRFVPTLTTFTQNDR